MAITLDVLNVGEFGIEDGGSTTIALTTTSAAASRSTIVLSGACGGFDPTTTISDNGPGLTWTRDMFGTGTGTGRIFFYSAYAPAGLASGTVITLTLGGSCGDRYMCATSFLGIKTSSPVDTTAASTGYTGTAWTTGSMATQAGSVIWGASYDGNNSHTSLPTAPSLEAHDIYFPSGSAFTSCYRIESAASTYTVAGTWDSALANGVNGGVAYLQASVTGVMTTSWLRT